MNSSLIFFLSSHYVQDRGDRWRSNVLLQPGNQTRGSYRIGQLESRASEDRSKRFTKEEPCSCGWFELPHTFLNFIPCLQTESVSANTFFLLALLRELAFVVVKLKKSWKGSDPLQQMINNTKRPEIQAPRETRGETELKIICDDKWHLKGSNVNLTTHFLLIRGFQRFYSLQSFSWVKIFEPQVEEHPRRDGFLVAVIKIPHTIWLCFSLKYWFHLG